MANCRMRKAFISSTPARNTIYRIANICYEDTETDKIQGIKQINNAQTTGLSLQPVSLQPWVSPSASSFNARNIGYMESHCIPDCRSQITAIKTAPNNTHRDLA